MPSHAGPGEHSDERRGKRPAVRPLGLPDDAFAQRRPDRGMITKSEVRAVALYKLGLRPDSVVWDIGAGSGSVALEAAAIARNGRVYAVERDAESMRMLRENIRRLGPENVAPIRGEAPDALECLPAPDCVFIGGGGAKTPEIIARAAQRLRPGGRVVANFAAMERAIQAHADLTALGFQTDITMISASRAKPLPDGSLRLNALNPVFVVSAARAAAPEDACANAPDAAPNTSRRATPR